MPEKLHNITPFWPLIVKEVDTAVFISFNSFYSSYLHWAIIWHIQDMHLQFSLTSVKCQQQKKMTTFKMHFSHCTTPLMVWSEEFKSQCGLKTSPAAQSHDTEHLSVSFESEICISIRRSSEGIGPKPSSMLNSLNQISKTLPKATVFQNSSFSSYHHAPGGRAHRWTRSFMWCNLIIFPHSPAIFGWGGRRSDTCTHHQQQAV